MSCLSLLHFLPEPFVNVCLFISKSKARDSTHSNFSECETPSGLAAAAGRRREHFWASFCHNSRASCCSQVTWSFLFLPPGAVHIQPWCCAEAVLTLCHYTSIPPPENHPTAAQPFKPGSYPSGCMLLRHGNTIARSAPWSVIYIWWSVIYIWHLHMTSKHWFLCCRLLNSTQLLPTSHVTLYLWLLIRFGVFFYSNSGTSEMILAEPTSNPTCEADFYILSQPYLSIQCQAFVSVFLPSNEPHELNYHNHRRFHTCKFSCSSPSRDRHSRRDRNRCLPPNASPCFDTEFW